MKSSPKATELKKTVRQRYGAIARQGATCCGADGCCDSLGGVDFSEGYEGVDGYEAAADLGLGCGLPTAEGFIRPGETVLDLGSGAGNDAFIAAALVGESGRVIGLDMTPDMVALARQNAVRLGRPNVEFIQGEIEDIPLPDGEVDLVVSNCVLNLVPDKVRAFNEINRVLKPGGRFAISDIVLRGELPPAVATASLAYVGCVAGALQEADYLATIAATGFHDVLVEKARAIALPARMLTEVLGEADARQFAASGVQIMSITVTGRR